MNATVRIDAAAKADAPPVPRDGLYECGDCLVPIKDDTVLPFLFYRRSGGVLTRFWEAEPETYAMSEFRKGADGEGCWVDTRNVTIVEGRTAREFLDIQED
ncbi:hypothetical protein FV226_05560 [Methylobacterium sp. WL12]|uniref:hypothetical protein n=1 Tax=Methylobacterium sp. WL12 TaxID=2603890 RepID=UPI0011C7192E|nr:hypothetical protein [Methylobacterium sp. WL12]TXM74838.1 hypothetical protein FV226_05560 [Methylobacterium sp. WL12]